MSRRRHLESQPAVSLFPFLAVLICTMGTLIVLLVVVVQQARNTTTVMDAPAEDPSPLVTATPVPHPAPVLPVAQPEMVQHLEDARWANELLETSRKETLAGLEERRGVLSRIEDQVRSLSEQLGLLETQAQSLLDAEANKLAPNQESDLYLTNLRLEIEAAKKLLAEKQAEAAEYRQRYAIIPYDGPNGTRRRPIYIECLADSVVIQPEGIRFEASDFAVKDASNPLASALRAYREYLSNAGLIQVGGEPYPLIVVRPNGERAYSACRAAMRSWDDEFGYELVPSDMKLAYPPVDLGLKAFLVDAVAQARARIQPPLTIASGGPRGNPGLPVGTNVGPATNARNGSMLLNSDATPAVALPPNPTNSGSGNSGTMSFAQAAANAAAAERPELPTYSVGKGVGGGLVPNGSAMQRPAQRRPDQAGTSSRRRRRQLVRGAARANGRDVSDQAMAQFSGARMKGRGSNSGGSDGQSATGASAPMNSTASNNANTGSQSTSGGVEGGSPGGTSQSVSNAVASGSTGGAMGAASAGATSDADGSQPAAVTASFSKSFAETQGVNWALPNAADGSIAIARPITATCEPGRIVVRTDKGNVAIPIQASSVGESVQPLVSKVWEIIDGWGIAGPGVYWKPTIHIRVKPGSEATFSELHALLQDSGLEVKQRK